MTGLLQAALNNPYAALRVALGGPLHPGGQAATEDLLDRAEVRPGTRLVDLGCGAGEAVELATRRGAVAIGLDHAPGQAGQVCGTLTHLPFPDGSFEVVLSECAICLASDLGQALDEAVRVLAPGGRLAMSDVTLTTDLGDVPAPLAEALCLTGPRSPEDLISRLEARGLSITSQKDHREDLLAMRDTLRSRIDIEGLLAAMGDEGQRIQLAVDRIEAAVEAGSLGYVSLVATRPG